MENFILKIPKVLLHVHLEGTLQPELLFKLSKQNNINIPFQTVDDVKKAFKNLENLNDFLKLYYQGSNLLCKKEDFYEITSEYLTTCDKNNVRHLELMFDPQVNIFITYTGTYI